MYDVREPKRLARVAKIVKGYGERIQLSIFCCFLNNRQRERLKFELKKEIEGEDSLIIVDLCNPCVKKLRTKNSPDAWPEDPGKFEII